MNLEIILAYAVGAPAVIIVIGIMASIGVRVVKSLNFDSASSANTYERIVRAE